jgi:hypothetical protein
MCGAGVFCGLWLPLFMGALCGSGEVLREISGVVWLFFVYLLLFSVCSAQLLGGGLWLFVFYVCIVFVFVLVVACAVEGHFFRFFCIG